MLAQSSFLDFQTIGRTPDSAGARSVPAHARRKRAEGKRKKDAAVILAIAAAVILLIISGCVIFLNYFMGASILPSFDWMTLHIAAAIVSFLLMLLHMKQEWS